MAHGRFKWFKGPGIVEDNSLSLPKTRRPAGLLKILRLAGLLKTRRPAGPLKTRRPAGPGRAHLQQAPNRQPPETPLMEA